jgi:hypothetical protein
MKKIVIFTFIALLAIPAVSFSATGTIEPASSILANDGTSGSKEGSIARLSTGVSLYFNTDTTGYAIITKHESGPLGYGTAADTTAIYRTDDATNVAEPGASDSSEFTGWDSM